MRHSPTSIPRVGWLHDFGAVPVDNGSFASCVRDAQGREWVCKLALAMGVSWAAVTMGLAKLEDSQVIET